MNICGEVGVLKVTLMIKTIIEIISVLVPIILVLMVMKDITKFVLYGDDSFYDTFKMICHRFFTAVTVFFIPTLIMSVLSFASDSRIDTKKILCLNEATKENIERLEIAIAAENAKEKEEYEKRKEENANKLPVPGDSNLTIDPENPSDNNNYVIPSGPIPTSSRMTPFINGIQRALNTGDCMSFSDNCACPTIGKFSGFYFTMEGKTGRSMSAVKRTGNDKMIQVKVKCSDGSYISKTVNSKAKTEFEKAFDRLCKIRTTGINGVKISSSNLRIDGTLNERTTSSRKTCSPHAYGIAIDINYDLTITVNGVSYKPYASQGKKTKENYDNFVKAIGSESNTRNVNYILWTHVFKPSGFTWGGNWSVNSFDPMHYEVKL